MSDKIGDSSAFPTKGFFPTVLPEGGLSKREWFASMAIQGKIWVDPLFGNEGKLQEDFHKALAKSAFQLADFMLTEGEK